jgi:hypothetical protein
VTACASADRDQAVCALFNRFPCESIIDDVMKHNAAPAVNGIVQIGARAKRRDGEGHLPLGAGGKISFEPVVGFVDDLIDSKGGRRLVRMIAIMRRERFGDLVQPFIEHCLRSCIQRRKRAHDSRFALGYHELWPGNEEKRRPDDGQAQAIKKGWKCHRLTIFTA